MPSNILLLVSPDFLGLQNMENMNAGFVAEGLTSRKRAIARYMKTKGTKDDKKALKFLQDIGGFAQEMDSASVLKKARAGIGEIRQLAGVADVRFRPTRPEASPLALYAMALYSLEPRFGQYDPDLGWDCLEEAVELGCDPARGLYADMALRTPLSPADAHVRNSLQEFLEEALEAMNKDVFEAVDEELLLVTGRRFALYDTGETLLSFLVRKGLVILAKADHVDALRLLALDHAHDPSPETLWAREEIKSQAQRGRAHAMLVMGQHLAGLYGFWLPEGDWEENQAAARDLFEKCAPKNDPWAALALAHMSLPWTSMVEDPENQDEVLECNRAVKMLETLAHERNFAPAKAMLGAWLFTCKHDSEAAWPLLRDACAQKFSRQCEAACADFLLWHIIYSMYVEVDRRRSERLLDDFVDDHGGWELWLQERRIEVAQYERFGLLTLAVRRLSFQGVYEVDENAEPDASDAPEDPDGLSKSEMRDLRHGATAFLMGGRLAVHTYLVLLTRENTPMALQLREHIEDRIHADMADGNEDCFLAVILFMKRLFGANPCDVAKLERKCMALAGGSSTARAIVNILHVHLIFEHEEDGLGLEEVQLERETTVLNTEYRRAYHCVDLPVLCALPVLFKYARSQFSPTVVRKSIEFVTLRLFGKKCDLKGLVAALNDIPYTWELDMDLLWENLGLVPGIDFAPRAMTAGYETSAMRSRRSAEARKNARRKKDKLKKDKLKKDRLKKDRRRKR